MHPEDAMHPGDAIRSTTPRSAICQCKLSLGGISQNLTLSFGALKLSPKVTVAMRLCTCLMESLQNTFCKF